MTDLIDIFSAMCEDKGIHGLILVGNENEYAVQTVGEYDAIGESLYFALSEDAKLLRTVADAVRIASEVVPSYIEDEDIDMRKDIFKCQKMAELIDKYDELSGKVEGLATTVQHIERDYKRDSHLIPSI